MANNLDWLDDIEYDDLLIGDMKLIKDRCGEEVLRILMENVPKIHVYMSEKPLVEAQKRYIAKHYSQGNAKEIAARLGVSESFVYKAHKKIVRERSKDPEPEDSNLFQEEKS